MDIRKLIREQIRHLVEQLDLSDYESTKIWMADNAPEGLFDDDGALDWDYTDPMTGMSLEELIWTYINKYTELTSESDVEIHRMVLLNDISELNLNEVGVFWSFNEDGVGAYGVGKKYTGNKPFILTANVSTDGIDWEQGFYSFLAYGKSEFECYLNKGARVEITKINDKTLEVPIEGIA